MKGENNAINEVAEQAAEKESTLNDTQLGQISGGYHVQRIDSGKGDKSNPPSPIP